MRGNQREHRLLQVLVERHRLLAEAEQKLASRVGVIQRSMRAWLPEPELGREQRQAVAGGRGHQDARDTERVEDLRRLVPVAGGGEEVDVKAPALTDRLPAAQGRT